MTEVTTAHTRPAASRWLGLVKASPLAITAGGIAVAVGLLRVAPPAAAVVAVGLIGILAVRRPGWLLALSVSGVFVYLLVLRLGGHAPRSRVTAPYYVVVGGALLLAVWQRREVVRSTLSVRLNRVWLGAAAVLALWFTANALLLGNGTTAARFAAILLLASVPSAALALAMGRRGLSETLPAFVVIGLAAAIAEVVALSAGVTAVGGRFRPFASLDPISAAIVPAVGALAALALAPRRGRGALVRVIPIALCTAAVVVPGSRGPIASLLAGAAVLLVAQWREGRRAGLATATAALVAGLALGAAGSDVAGTSHYWSRLGLLHHPPAVTIPARTTPTGKPSRSGSSGATPPAPIVQAGEIDSGRIRIEWAKEAIKAIPGRPVFGHGVAQLVDRTPEAYQMGIAGERVWPHNDLIEAGFSLGILGFVPFVLFLLLPAAALVRHGARGASFVAGLLAFAFAESNLSGEIGTDVILWTAAAAAMASTFAVKRPASAPAGDAAISTAAD